MVLFTNPAESRFAGGFVGAFAELTAENGKVTLDATVSEDKFLDTIEARQRSLVIPPDLAERYRRYDRCDPDQDRRNAATSQNEHNHQNGQ